MVFGSAYKRYLIRETYVCRLRRVPEYLETLKVVIDAVKLQGITEHALMVDISHSMDTAYDEYEVDSIDNFFEFERGIFVNPDADTQRMIDHINEVTVSGHREFYEIVM